MNRAGVMKWASHMLVLVCILHVPPLLPRCSRARVRAALRAARRPRICCGTMDWAGTMDRAGVMEWASHMLVLTLRCSSFLFIHLSAVPMTRSPMSGMRGQCAGPWTDSRTPSTFFMEARMAYSSSFFTSARGLCNCVVNDTTTTTYTAVMVKVGARAEGGSSRGGDREGGGALRRAGSQLFAPPLARTFRREVIIGVRTRGLRGGVARRASPGRHFLRA